MTLESSGLSRQKHNYIRRYAGIIANLPEPGTVWMERELEPSIKHILKGLRNNGIVSHVEKKYQRDAGETVWKWRTEAEAHKVAQSIVNGSDGDSMLPCGHNSLLNKRGVEGITCGVCECVFARSEVRT